MTKLLSTTILMTLIAASPALADDHEHNNNGVSGYVALGAFTNPDYEGSDDYDVNPLGALRVQYGTYYVETKGLGARANISPFEELELGPVINFNMGRDDDVENDTISRLREIDDAVEAGMFARIPFNNVFTTADELSFEMQVLTDVSDTHEGTLVSLGPGYSYQVSPKMRLSTSAEITYATDDYMQTYFGVDANNSARSGLSQFDAEGGIKNIGASVVGNYQLNERWGVIGLVGYDALLGDAADSPIVDDEGSSNQFFAGAGLTYRF